MMTIGLTYDEVRALEPMWGAFARATKLLGGKGWGGRRVTARDAKEAGVPLYDVLCVVSRLRQTDADIARRLRLWAADCAARVLHIFEDWNPADDRPRKAIIAARRYARGEIDEAVTDAARDAGVAASRGTPAGGAADWAAGAAGITAEAVFWGAWWIAMSSVAAVRLDADDDAAAGAAEREWQYERLCQRLEDPEPDDWPLPERSTA